MSPSPVMKMKRHFAGLYEAENVRCEHFQGGGWKFDIRGRGLAVGRDWVEYSPHGHWCHMGTWLRRKDGLFVADQLIAGTHFWDYSLHKSRLYTEEVYAAIRGERAYDNV